MKDQTTIAVIGATGQQGGSVVRALKANGSFRVRALSRDPSRYSGPADEVDAANLAKPDTLTSAFAGASGVFAVTNAWGDNVDEVAEGSAAIVAARAAGVDHFIWSSLPDVMGISDGTYAVAHFTNKAKVATMAREAGFAHVSIVEAPFYFSNLMGAMAPQPLGDGRMGWTVPIATDARVIHAGDIDEIGTLVTAAFATPGVAGDGAPLALSGDLLSFDDIVATLNGLGHHLSVQQVPGETYTSLFPGASEMAEMMAYWSDHTYFGPDAAVKIARAQALSPVPATRFADWARQNMPAADGT